jgi:polyol permease family
MQAADALDPAPRSFLDRIGIHPPLVWGYVGLFLFMIGDGIELGYLSKYLIDQKIADKESASLVFTAYGVTTAIAAWLSGALSDLLSPRRVMANGLAIWVVFEVAFLMLGLKPGNYAMITSMYAMRGFGYPLFAFGFLVWISVAAPRHRLGTSLGWFWFAFTGGLLALSPRVADYSIPRIGRFETLWLSLGLVVLGGLIALLGLHEPTGKQRLAGAGTHPIKTLFASISIAWEHPKTFIGCLVRVINTAAQQGFVVFMPVWLAEIGFAEGDWFRILSYMFISNVIWNLLFGIIGDRLGWRQTVAFCGGLGCTITTLLLYYAARSGPANYWLVVLAAVLYGATLAGYVPLSALMPSLAPEKKGAAMSLLNLGAGAANWVGPGVLTLFWEKYGVGVVMWIYAGLYLISAVMALFLTLPKEEAEGAPA